MGFWPPNGFRAILCPKKVGIHLIFMIMGLMDSSDCYFGLNKLVVRPENDIFEEKAPKPGNISALFRLQFPFGSRIVSN